VLIKLNTAIAIFRERSWLKKSPIAEVLVVSGVTASVSYMVRRSSQCTSLVTNNDSGCLSSVVLHPRARTHKSHVLIESLLQN
jgi:hypothetical protein